MEGDTHVTRIQSYALGEWVTGSGAGTPLHDAVTGEQIADASSEGLDFAAMLELRPRVRRAGAAAAHLPPARAHAQGAGAST